MSFFFKKKYKNAPEQATAKVLRYIIIPLTCVKSNKHRETKLNFVSICQMKKLLY